MHAAVRVASRYLFSGGMVLASLLAAGCGDEAAESTTECDQECKDEIATRAVREMMKLLYNLTLQGNDVGEQDELVPCPFGGTARVFGNATSDAKLGTTEVDLTYEFNQCAYLERDEDPKENYDVKLDATLTQQGVIAVQPSVSSALVIRSDSLGISGTLGDPPVSYAEEDCKLRLSQNGNKLSGRFCGRTVGVDL
jgi:hypothetical protein